MKFICDAMLGSLAKYLRILGLDTIYIHNLSLFKNYTEDEEPPYFFTRRQRRIGYKRCIYVKSQSVQEQLKELKHIINPYIDYDKLMMRCITCNTELMDIEKISVEQCVPEFIYHQYENFKKCPSCKKIYWGGSHTVNMHKFIKEIFG